MRSSRRSANEPAQPTQTSFDWSAAANSEPILNLELADIRDYFQGDGTTMREEAVYEEAVAPEDYVPGKLHWRTHFLVSRSDCRSDWRGNVWCGLVEEASLADPTTEGAEAHKYVASLVCTSSVDYLPIPAPGRYATQAEAMRWCEERLLARDYANGQS